MAKAIVTLKLMPSSPEVDLDQIREEVQNNITEFAGKEDSKYELIPVAFGLKALQVMFIMDESIGSTEKLEEQINAIEGVQSVDVTDVRRTIG